MCLPNVACEDTVGWHVLCWFVIISVAFSTISLVFTATAVPYIRVLPRVTSQERLQMMEARMERVEQALSELKMSQVTGTR